MAGKPEGRELKPASNGLVAEKFAKNRKPLSEKQFKIRESLLTELLERKEIVTAHNIVIALFVHFAICGVLSDLIDHGRINLGFSNIYNMFAKPQTAFLILLTLHLIPILLLYPSFYIWSHLRTSGYFGKYNKALDTLFYSTVAGIIGLNFYLPFYAHFFLNPLPFANAAAIAIEKLRISMKMYAFTRTNVPRVLNFGKPKIKPDAHQDQNQNKEEYKPDSENSENRLRNRKTPLKSFQSPPAEPEISPENKLPNFDETLFCPSLKTFLYYLYAPTFIYRDNYPRSPVRRWSFIFSHLAHVAGSIIFYNLIHQKFGYVLIQDFGPNNPKTPKDLVNILFSQYIVGFSACMLGWLGLLHTTQNIFAELLRFGDRGFYKDWWNCTSMSEYHRTWNTPVQDFLYNYVYKEAKEYGIGDKWAPALLVFMISNIFHEYASMFILQFFFPVMGIMFAGPGTFLTFIPNRKFPKLGNIFLHWSFGFGYALMHMFYTMEYFARVNGCPAAETPLKDFFVPRFASCGAIKWS